MAHMALSNVVGFHWHSCYAAALQDDFKQDVT